MTDPASPSPATPPPLPSAGPRPVLPLEAGPFPPSLPGPHVPPGGGPFYKPPVFFETPAPAAAGGPPWALWGVGAIVVLLVGAGLGFLAAVRSGPSTAAAARGAPAPAWKPVTTPAARAQAAPVAPAVAPPVAPPTAPPSQGRMRAVPSVPTPAASLPAERQIDLQLKKLWETAEKGGLATKTLRTMKSVRGSGFSVQPVQCEFAGGFPETVVFLQGVQSSLPTAFVQSLELTTPPGDGPGRTPLRVLVTINLCFAPETGAGLGEAAAGAPLAPAPDLARALADLARSAESKLQFTRLAVKAEAAAATADTPMRPKVTFEANAQSDVDVAGLMHTLSGARLVSDLHLIKSETQSAGGLYYRACEMEFVVRAPDPHGRAPAAAPVVLNELINPFAAPAWLRFGAARPQQQVAPQVTPQRPAPAPAKPLDVGRALQGINLESVTSGKTPGCIINGRLYRVGHTVNGLTIEKINPDGIVLRHESQRFEVKLKKP